MLSLAFLDKEQPEIEDRLLLDILFSAILVIEVIVGIMRVLREMGYIRDIQVYGVSGLDLATIAIFVPFASLSIQRFSTNPYKIFQKLLKDTSGFKNV